MKCPSTLFTQGPELSPNRMWCWPLPPMRLLSDSRSARLPRQESLQKTRASTFASSVLSMMRSEEHTSELQSRGHLVCRLLLEKKKNRVRVEPSTEMIVRG